MINPERLEIIKKHLNGEITQKDAATQIGISEVTYVRIRKEVEAMGYERKAKERTNTRHLAESDKPIIQDYINGKLNQKSALAKLHINRKAFLRIMHEYQEEMKCTE